MKAMFQMIGEQHTLVQSTEKGCRDQDSNYKPVSLTSDVSKVHVIESLLRDDIVERLEEYAHTRFSACFRKSKSCLTNLLVFLDKVTESINNWLCVDVIFLDFAKVLHQRLLHKLSVHGIHGKIFKWISA